MDDIHQLNMSAKQDKICSK